MNELNGSTFVSVFNLQENKLTYWGNVAVIEVCHLKIMNACYIYIAGMTAAFYLFELLDDLYKMQDLAYFKGQLEINSEKYKRCNVILIDHFTMIYKCNRYISFSVFSSK